MAYQVPPRWSHGDIPTGAHMQKYSDALNALKTKADGGLWNMAGRAGQTGGGTAWTFVHVHRYLYYDSSGEIIDPDNAENSVALQDPDDGTWGRYDLSTVGWLYPGKMYNVDDVNGCFEVWW